MGKRKAFEECVLSNCMYEYSRVSFLVCGYCDTEDLEVFCGGNPT